MSFVLIFIANCIVIFIVYVILNSRIRKNTAPGMLERYTREVENLIVELNSALDDAVNVSEEKVEELKKVIAAAEKILKRPAVKKVLAEKREEHAQPHDKQHSTAKSRINTQESDNLLQKTRHLRSMGYSGDEISRILKIQRAEVDFLESISR
jgi:hypothetical protein